MGAPSAVFLSTDLSADVALPEAQLALENWRYVASESLEVSAISVSWRGRFVRRAMASAAVDLQQPVDVRRARVDRRRGPPLPRKVTYGERYVAGVRCVFAQPKGRDPQIHIVYMHGGGFSLGLVRAYWGFSGLLARGAVAQVLAVDYRLSPEHPYPAAVEDCLAIYRTLIQTVDSRRVVIAGDSAGGGAALSALCQLRDRGDPLPACAYFISPFTDLTGSGETMISNAGCDPIVTMDLFRDSVTLYLGGADPTDPEVSPAFAAHAGLPSLLIQAGTEEMLLADSTRLAGSARSAGVEVDLDAQPGMWHVYPVAAGFMPEATKALSRAVDFISVKTGTKGGP